MNTLRPGLKMGYLTIHESCDLEREFVLLDCKCMDSELATLF